MEKGYKDVLDSLAESLRVSRRQQFLAQLATNEGPVVIPSPTPSPEQFPVSVQ